MNTICKEVDKLSICNPDNKKMEFDIYPVEQNKGYSPGLLESDIIDIILSNNTIYNKDKKYKTTVPFYRDNVIIIFVPRETCKPTNKDNIILHPTIGINLVEYLV